MNEAFVAFWSTLILIWRTSRIITFCGISCDLERKYVVFATPVSQKRRRQPIFFLILDSLSAQRNVPYTKFSRKTMKHLNHNASTLRGHYTKSFHVWWDTGGDTGQWSLKTMALLRCFGLVWDYQIINSGLLYTK